MTSHFVMQNPVPLFLNVRRQKATLVALKKKCQKVPREDAMMVEEAKRRGRPPKAAGEKKNVNFTFRARPHLREQLAKYAEAGNRSISEEIERRLEETFGGAFTTDYRTRTLIEHIVQIISMMEKASGKKWWDDEIAAGMCGDAIRQMIDGLMPKCIPTKNRLLELAESDLARQERETKEALWEATLRLDAMNRAIVILQGEPGSPDFIKDDDKLSRQEIKSSTK